MRVRLLATIFIVLAFINVSYSHEYWIEPRKFEVLPGETIEADLKNGEHFKGGKLYYLTHRFKRFEMHTPDEIVKITGNEGDQPALKAKARGEGLYVLVYQSIFDSLTFETFEKFENYLKIEGLEHIVARHAERKLARTHFTEKYSRRIKALVKVGEGKGADKLTGLEYEMVALQNPYHLDANDKQSIEIQLFLKGKPAINRQINIFQDNGKIFETNVHTNALGIAKIPLTGGGKFMLSSVNMEDGDNDDATELPEWVSLWANLTFALPASEGSIAPAQ